MTCPSDLELSRAIANPAAPEADPGIAAHLASCAACRATWDRTRALIDLARELPVELPPRVRREEMRTAVLAAAASVTRRPARPPWLAPVISAAAAAGAIAYLAVPRGSPPPLARTPALPARHGHGVVRPHPGASFAESPSGPDEIVRLTEGSIDVEVEPLAPGERFRVVVGGAEIEVRGTVFTVTASAEHLTGVTVARGRVDVRPEAGAPAVLVAGQSWRVALAAEAEPAPAMIPPPRSRIAPAPHRTAVPGPPPAPRPAQPTASHAASPAAPRAASSLAPHLASPGLERAAYEPTPADAIATAAAKPEPPAPRNPEELSYDQAWEALRANDFTRAASGFARVLLLAPDSALVEDASFWRGVALARGKRSAEAVSAFRDFLDSYAGSARAGQASAMLGWILIDARVYDEAERRFRAAAADADPAVRSSATAGLHALASRAR
jgi:TolA-binding protein